MSAKQLTKTAAAHQKSTCSILEAITKGGPLVWLSCLVMGLGNLVSGQIIKGLLFLAIEIGIIWFLVIPGGGFDWNEDIRVRIVMLPEARVLSGAMEMLRDFLRQHRR